MLIQEYNELASCLAPKGSTASCWDRASRDGVDECEVPEQGLGQAEGEGAGGGPGQWGGGRAGQQPTLTLVRTLGWGLPSCGAHPGRRLLLTRALLHQEI